MEHFIQDINYSSNPNFKPFKIGVDLFSIEDEVFISEIIEKLDATINYLCSINSPNAVKKFMEINEQNIVALKERLNSRTVQDKELNDTLKTIIDKALEKTISYITYKTETKLYEEFNEINKFNDSQRKELATLKSDGYLEFQIPHSNEFLKICNEQLQFFRKKYEGQEDWRGANSYESTSGEYKFLNDFIIEKKIVELISEYKKMKMQVFYMAADYSHHRQKWFRNNHTYNQLVPTNYYHTDADVNIAKMLVYLTDVKEGDGPFKIVKGSNNLSRSVFTTYIHSSIDTEVSVKFKKPDNLYGRGLFLYRKDLLMKFPKKFMGSTHFGDDLEANTALSKYLIDNTVTFYNNKGAAILFDGYTGIHAGSNAHTGERLAVQIAFMKSKETPTSGYYSRIKQKAKSVIYKRS